MPNLTVQRFIYRNLSCRPTVNRSLDRLGSAINKLGLPYATRLTRSKAIIFASKDPIETQKAVETLSPLKRLEAYYALEDFKHITQGIPQKDRTFSKPYKLFGVSTYQKGSVLYSFYQINPVSQLFIRPMIRLAGKRNPILGGLLGTMGSYAGHWALLGALASLTTCASAFGYLSSGEPVDSLQLISPIRELFLPVFKWPTAHLIFLGASIPNFILGIIKYKRLLIDRLG